MTPDPALEHYQRRLAVETDCADVHARLVANDPSLVVIDARATTDHAQRRIPGAVSLPHREISAAALDAHPDEVEFVTYCWGPHCNGATKAAARIAALGRPVREMLGGVWGWEQEGYRFEGLTVPTHRIGLLCFEGMDLLDLVGPYETFHTANRLRHRAGEQIPFEVLTIGEAARAFGGLGVTPQLAVADAGALDVLVVPGAIEVDSTFPDAALRHLAPTSVVLASVCTGAFYLQRNGLLGEGPVTTHWEDLDALSTAVGGAVVENRRWCDNGPVVTAGGVSSGMAMALHLVERFAGRELAERVARQMDYVWTEDR